MSEYIYKPPASLPPGSVVIAYLRDSGGPNQEASIGQQEKVINEYCQEHGLILQRSYSDSASGRKTKRRDEFLDMFKYVMSTPRDLLPAGLLLWAYSRFSRDILDFNYFLSGILRQGLTVHSLTEEMPEGIAGQVLLTMKAYTNADFSDQLSKNIKRGISDLVAAGYNNGGIPPRGYRIVKEKHGTRRNGAPRIGIRWEPDPELAPLVKLAWELRAQGKGYAEITRATGGKIYKIKGSWTSHFRNKSYLGIGKAGEKEIPDHHESLITWELWEAVRKIEKAMPRHGLAGDPAHPRRRSHPSLLSGLSFCIHCGAAMTLHTARDYRSYICGSRDRQKIYKDCAESRSVNARKADRVILDIVLNRILSPSAIEDMLDKVQSQLIDTTKIDREIGNVNNQLILTERSIARLLKLAEGAGDLEEIAARLKDLKREKGEHIARMIILKAERDVEIPTITPEALEVVFSTWRSKIERVAQAGDMLTAKKLIAQFVSKIELGRNTAIIHYTYPLLEPSDNDMSLSAHLFHRKVTHSIIVSME